MPFGDYLYFALLYTAVFALPVALRAIPRAFNHWMDIRRDVIARLYEMGHKPFQWSYLLRPLTLYRHLRECREYKRQLHEGEHPDRDLLWASGSFMVSVGVAMHAVEEVLYKSGRILQFINGIDTLGGATAVLNTAAITGIISLSLAVHYLNRTATRYHRIYWTGHALLLTAWLIFGT